MKKITNSKKKLIQKCVKILKKECRGKEESKCEKKRREVLERAGMSKEQVRRIRGRRLKNGRRSHKENRKKRERRKTSKDK